MMRFLESIREVMPATTATFERLTYADLPLEIILKGNIFYSALRGVVFDGSVRGVVNDPLSNFFGKGGAISSLRMTGNGILITESAWTFPAIRGLGINSVLYEELVNTYFPQAQIVENSGMYGMVNARRVLEGKMTVKQVAFYRLGWRNYRARNSLADFFVRPGANPPLIEFSHMERIF